MTSSKLKTGLLGEKIAVKFLRRSGFCILKQRFRCVFGEMDIIAQEKKTIVFIEVKTRTDTDFCLPQEAIDREKKRHLIRVAQVYQKIHILKDNDFRFDVVSIKIKSNGKVEIEHIKDAFSMQEGGY